MLRRNASALALTALWLGCAGDQAAGNDPAHDLCDGSDDLRLAVRLLGASDYEVGQRIMFDNGGHFLFVDGRCAYHARGAGLWEPVGTGTLEPDEAEELSADLQMGAWGNLAGTYQGVASADGGTVLFEDGEHEIECGSGCGVDPIDPISDAAFLWGDRLADDGEPIAGDIRMTVIRQSDPISYVESVEWPLEVDIDLVAEEPEEGKTPGSAVFQGTDAEALRAIRDEYLAGDHGYFSGSFIPFRPAGQAETHYRAYFRDVLPFESGDGLVPPLSNQ
jgi:hypothetical protein